MNGTFDVPDAGFVFFSPPIVNISPHFFVFCVCVIALVKYLLSQVWYLHIAQECHRAKTKYNHSTTLLNVYGELQHEMPKHKYKKEELEEIHKMRIIKPKFIEINL